MPDRERESKGRRSFLDDFSGFWIPKYRWGKGRKILVGSGNRPGKGGLTEIEGSFSRSREGFSGGFRHGPGEGREGFGGSVRLLFPPKENPEMSQMSLFHACSSLSLLPHLGPTRRNCRRILLITCPRLRSSSAAIWSIFERISGSTRKEKGFFTTFGTPKFFTV